MRPLAALIVALIVCAVASSDAGQSSVAEASSATAPEPGAAAGAPTWRVSEPVVVAGSELGHFANLPIGRVGVWRLTGQVWERITSQVDQRDDGDSFVPVEDGNFLDGNDELVFMADQLGDPRPGDDSWPPGVSRSLSPAEIAVTDPLRPTYVGYAYVFDSPAATPAPLVTFDGSTTEIESDAYVLGFATEADGFFGLKRLSLMGDARDRVDRSKFRLSIPQFGEFTEESLGAMGGFTPVQPVVEGPVRLVMDASGESFAYEARATLFSMDLDTDALPPIPLELRMSLDFSPNASGATYRAENLPRGVPIDGQPDTVPGLMVPMWREVEFEEGRLVTLATGEPTPLLVRPYYKDDATPDDTDTGDQMSYGDNGISASTINGLVEVGFLGQMVALAPDSDVTAADLAEQLANPLVVEVDVAPAGKAIYLPLTIKKA